MLVACTTCRRQYDVNGIKAGDAVRCRCGQLVTVPEGKPREGRVLRCPSCGAPLRQPAAHGANVSCEYCHTETSARGRDLGHVCPTCFAQLPVAARFCWECGLEIRPESVRLTPAKARCPRCQGALVLREFERAHVTECTACGGVWLDDKSFERVVAEKDGAALGPLLGRAAAPQSEGAADPHPVRYVPCPLCSQLMHRKNMGGVVVDWCQGHGWWFDAEELERVMRFVAAGGLDRARQREIENARREVETARTRARSLMSGRDDEPDRYWLMSGLSGLMRTLFRRRSRWR